MPGQCRHPGDAMLPRNACVGSFVYIASSFTLAVQLIAMLAYTNEPTHALRGSIASPGWRCLLYTSPSPRDGLLSRMPSSA